MGLKRYSKKISLVLMGYLGIVLVKPSEASMTLTRPEYPSLVLQCFSMACDTIRIEKERASRLIIAEAIKRKLWSMTAYMLASYLYDLPGVFLVLFLPCDPVKYEQTFDSFYKDSGYAHKTCQLTVYNNAGDIN